MTTLTHPPTSPLTRTRRVRVLRCGCTVASYQTRSGEIVQIIDAHASTCSNPTHAVDMVLRMEGA